MDSSKLFLSNLIAIFLFFGLPGQLNDVPTNLEPATTFATVPPEEKPASTSQVTPEIVPTPTPPEPRGNCSLVYDYSNWDQKVAYAICKAESGGDSNEANWSDFHGSCSGSFSLMQVACLHYHSRGTKDYYNPELNMRIANEIWSSEGFAPWAAYTSGKYLDYL